MFLFRLFSGCYSIPKYTEDDVISQTDLAMSRIESHETATLERVKTLTDENVVLLSDARQLCKQGRKQQALQKMNIKVGNDKMIQQFNKTLKSIQQNKATLQLLAYQKGTVEVTTEVDKAIRMVASARNLKGLVKLADDVSSSTADVEEFTNMLSKISIASGQDEALENATAESELQKLMDDDDDEEIVEDLNASDRFETVQITAGGKPKSKINDKEANLMN